MAHPPQDIRIIKTHKALAETLMTLLEQERFQKITVNAICEKAMVSRSTFYLHFADKYQLLLYCLHIEGKRLGESVEDKTPREILRSILLSIKEQHKIYNNLFNAQVNLELIQMFQNIFHDFFVKVLTECERKGAKLAGPIPLVAMFYINGMAGMIMRWIEEGFNYSVEEMATYQYNLLSNILPE